MCSPDVYVINTKTNKVIATLPFTDVEVYPAGKKVYVVNRYGKKVSVINTKTNTVIAKVTGLSDPTEIAFNPTGTKMYVTDCFNDNVYVVNTQTNTVIATVSLGAHPKEIAVNPAGTMVYVVKNGAFDIPDNIVSVIDTSTNTTEASNSNSHKLGISKMKDSFSKHKPKKHSKNHRVGKNHIV
jgi:YVTN family beta-propeller protein